MIALNSTILAEQLECAFNIVFSDLRDIVFFSLVYFMQTQ